MRSSMERSPANRARTAPHACRLTRESPSYCLRSEAGKVCWYYVEVIDVLGARMRLTPVMKAPAKGVPAAAKP